MGFDPPVLCSGMDVRLKWWSLGDETLKGPNPLSLPPPNPPFPCTSPTMCVLDSAHERIRAAFFLPLSPFATLHYPLCLTVSIHCPLHHLTLSTLSYFLHPLSPFTTLHYPLCLTVSIHCPPSPPYIIHPLSPFTTLHYPLCLTFSIHCPLQHLTLSTPSYCLHPLSPFTTLHYPSTVPLHHLTLSTLGLCWVKLFVLLLLFTSFCTLFF